MITIYKYTFNTADAFEIKMPKFAKFLSVQIQKGIPCIWCEVDTDNTDKNYFFQVYGTGHEVSSADCESLNYLGTYQLSDGGLVFHLYGEIRKK